MRQTNIVLYLERKPAAPLRPFVRTLWYVRAPAINHPYERVLPTGSSEMIWNLSRDFLVDCRRDGSEHRTTPSLVVGPRSAYELIATSDLTDLIGVALAPGALPSFTGDRADLFSNRNVPSDQIWGKWDDRLRSRLRDIASPADRLEALEDWLLAHLIPRLQRNRFSLHPAVAFALREFGQNPRNARVASIARETGWSERRFSQVFREQVGFSPKAWSRIQRLQYAVRLLRAGAEMSIAELALESGFYDQAHFANEFRAFSGINVTAYIAQPHPLWVNHIPTE